MHFPLSFLLKLTAAITSGAAVLLTLRRLRQDETIASFRRDIHATTSLMAPPPAALPPAVLPPAAPPTVLITGARGHGKSAFLNTACRALANEHGPLLLRAESKPPSGELGEGKIVVHANVDPGGDQQMVEINEEVTVALVEKGIELDATKEDVVAAVGGVECVVVVIRCSGPPKERSAVIRKLPEIAAPVRERGLHLIVVLTHKNSIKTMRQAEDLRREVAFKARTDCVYFIENYTSSKSSNLRYPIPIKNDFDTHFTVLTVVRQCLEFVKLYRSHSGNDNRKHEKDHAAVAAKSNHKVANAQL